MSSDTSSDTNSNSYNTNYSLLINGYISKNDELTIPNLYSVPNENNNFIYIGLISSEVYINKKSTEELVIYFLSDIVQETINNLNEQIVKYLDSKRSDNQQFPFLNNYTKENFIEYDFQDIQICDLKIDISENKNAVNIKGNIYAKKIELLYEEKSKNQLKSKKTHTIKSDSIATSAKKDRIETDLNECKSLDEENERKMEEDGNALCEKTKNYIRDGLILTPYYKNIKKERLGSSENEYTENFRQWVLCKKFQLRNKIKKYTISPEEEEKLIIAKTELLQIFPDIDKSKKTNYDYFFPHQLGFNLEELPKLFNAANAKSFDYKKNNLIRFPFGPNAQFNKNDKFNEWLNDMTNIIMNIDKCSETYRLADMQIKEMFPNITNKDFIIPERETANYSPIKEQIINLRSHYLGVRPEVLRATKSFRFKNDGLIKSPFEPNAQFNKTDKFIEWMKDMETIILHGDVCSDIYKKAEHEIKDMFPNIENVDYVIPAKANYHPVINSLTSIRDYYVSINDGTNLKVGCKNMGGTLNKTKKEAISKKKKKKKNKTKKR
jgi:hypothetical protein